MAEVPSVPVNGNYAPYPGYGGAEQDKGYASYTHNAATTVPTTVPPPSASSSAEKAAQADIPKDEVGWYFVEQYYTTLSRNPEKLYLFYNKRSQFVSGQETDKVQVCQGQRAINERIKELDFHDCKVRVTNVDSQASDSNIVIQVIGEISNKGQPHKKFTQTFVLATQTNGYFVLNDIFRYLIDEEDEIEADRPAAEEVQQEPAAEGGFQEPPPTITEVEPKTLTSSTDPVAIEHDAQQVDRELEDKVLIEETTEPTINGEPEPEVIEEAPPATKVPSVPVQPPTPTLEPEEVLAQEPEVPAEPEPSPSPPREATPPPAAAPAPKPSAPKTWASMAASANKSVATPVAPVMPAISQSRPTPPKTATPPASTPTSAAPPTAPAAQRVEDSPVDPSQGDEWTAVGGSHNRQQSRQTFEQQQGPITRAYIKNVHEGITSEELKSHLEQYGEVSYFDVNRIKVRPR